MLIVLRKAEAKDRDELFRWRNDSVTRQASFNSRPVTPEEHRAWFQAALAGTARALYIGETESGAPIGVVRFDLAGPRVAEVNINLAPEMRGQGLGSRLLEQSCALAVSERGPMFFIARIKESNAASVRSFKKAGFNDLFAYPDKQLDEEVLVLGRLADA